VDGTLLNNDHRKPFIEPKCPSCYRDGMYINRHVCTVCKGSGIASKGKDWDSFYSSHLMQQDSPIHSAQQVLPKLAAKLGPNLFFLTGRPERTREVTATSLYRHFGIVTRMLGARIPPPNSIDHMPQLVMRGDTDRRPASTYKGDFCSFISQNTRVPLLFIDDDERNTEMYKLYGIFLKAPECWEVFR
jgi:hypothetical protein